MKKKFSLLQELDSERLNPQDKQSFPKIKYQEYTIEVEGLEESILIPLRECLAFEQDVMSQTKEFDKNDLRKILRKYRGIRA